MTRMKAAEEIVRLIQIELIGFHRLVERSKPCTLLRVSPGSYIMREMSTERLISIITNSRSPGSQTFQLVVERQL